MYARWRPRGRWGRGTSRPIAVIDDARRVPVWVCMCVLYTGGRPLSPPPSSSSPPQAPPPPQQYLPHSLCTSVTLRSRNLSMTLTSALQPYSTPVLANIPTVGICVGIGAGGGMYCLPVHWLVSLMQRVVTWEACSCVYNPSYTRWV